MNYTLVNIYDTEWFLNS